MGESGRGGVEANARRRCESEYMGCACDMGSSASMLDTDTLVILGLSGAGCVNGTREAEGMICKVANDLDERT